MGPFGSVKTERSCPRFKTGSLTDSFKGPFRTALWQYSKRDCLCSSACFDSRLGPLPTALCAYSERSRVFSIRANAALQATTTMIGSSRQRTLTRTSQWLSLSFCMRRARTEAALGAAVGAATRAAAWTAITTAISARQTPRTVRRSG